jgi:DNA helicase II / ATP-dependent DNA helicase PcrA
VVGDPDQTIYTFTGATPEFLLRFDERHPGARTVALTDNYRSSPEVLQLANRLTANGPRGDLRPTRPTGPAPTITRLPSEQDELRALVEGVRRLLAEGVPLTEMAVLVRTNAQLAPIEEAFARAGIEFTLRGRRFYERREVRQAVALLRRARPDVRGMELVDAVTELFVGRLGFDPAADGGGEEARQRTASFETLLGILADMIEADGELGTAEFLAELDRRAVAEGAAQGSGVNLLTYHRAKGLEWDAVFLPALEEGLLPIRQAKTDETIAEERRLLYVGITRARRHLALSWSRAPSRFVAELRVPTVRTVPSAVRPAAAGPGPDGRLLAELQAWRRERSKRDGVPAYRVSHDATLAAIAEARPESIAALRRVKGMGPAKLEHYGAEILEIVGRARTF